MGESSTVAVDVSRFFLFEVTGDSSEAITSSVAEDFWADNDAQSCSCDTSDVQSVRDDDDDDKGEDDRLGCIGREEGSGSEDEDDDDDDDGDEVNQSGNGGVVKQLKESSMQDVSVELVSEKDRDRLFWESCLAS